MKNNQFIEIIEGGYIMSGEIFDIDSNQLLEFILNEDKN